MAWTRNPSCRGNSRGIIEVPAERVDPADNARDGGQITKRLWEIGDIVDVLEAWEAARQHDAVAAWREALTSVSLINDPKHWRDRAKEARAIADEMKDPDAKQMMLGIARDYVRLAERAEARAKGSPQSK